MFSHQNGCVILCLLIFLFKYLNSISVNDSITNLNENGLLRLKRQSTKICTLPTIKNGKVAIIRQNPSYLFLNISCEETYNLFPPNNNLAICVNGNWEDEIPQCTKCGHRLKKIFKPLLVNATYAKFGDFPWHVAIYQTTETKPEQDYICGGSIISEKCVLSAAHCFTDDGGKLFKSKEFYVAAGKYYSSYNSDVLDKYAQKRKVAKIIVHPDYKGILTNFGWDIAVIIVDKPFEISNIVQPACVDWTSSFESEQLVDNNFGQITGWGATETNLQKASLELRTLSVPFVSRPECLTHIPSDFFRYVTYDKICAGYLNGSSVCNGDSGGGLVFERIENQEFTYYIRGLVSLGVQSEGTCDYNKYSTYTRVSTHINFIRESITPAETIVPGAFIDTTIRNPLSHKNVGLLPSGLDCQYTKIIPGYEQTIYRFPWFALLIYASDMIAKDFRCTGVLIANRYVLTAAHCTYGEIIKNFGELSEVQLGQHLTGSSFINSPSSTISAHHEVETIVRHPEYDSWNRINDIALIRITIGSIVVSKRPKRYDANKIKPLCLPLNIGERNDAGTITVFGWGNKSYTSFTWLKLVNTTNQEDCTSAAKNLAENQKCRTTRDNSCHVVEGGIVVNEYMEPFYDFYLEGIVFSDPRCTNHKSEIDYTRISDYILWILDNIKS